MYDPANSVRTGRQKSSSKQMHSTAHKASLSQQRLAFRPRAFVHNHPPIPASSHGTPCEVLWFAKAPQPNVDMLVIFLEKLITQSVFLLRRYVPWTFVHVSLFCLWRPSFCLFAVFIFPIMHVCHLLMSSSLLVASC